MKSFLPLLSLALLASCTTAYKTGQTPDDVYYSPQRPQDEYVRVEKRDDQRYQNDDNRRYDDNRRSTRNDYYSEEDMAYERYLRMKVRNRRLWSSIDNDFYSYNPYYRYNNSFYYNSPWNAQHYWNYYYNPYSTVIIANPRTPVYNRPRTTNLHVFDDPRTPSNTSKAPSYKTRSFENSGQSERPARNVGRDLRRIYGTDNDSYSGSTNTNSSSGSSSTRSSSTGSSSSGSSSSGSKSTGGGGNAPVRRF